MSKKSKVVSALSLNELQRDPERLLDQNELCALLRKSQAWAERHRCRKTGPQYLKIGASVYYRAGDILDYINAHVVRTDSSARVVQ